MLMPLLAQTSQSGDSVNWEKWLVIIGALSFLQLICQPVIGWWLNSISSRLKDGDKKFEDHIVTLTNIGTRLERVEADAKEINGKLEAAAKEKNEMVVEGAGTVAGLRVEMVRDYVKRTEFNDLQTRMNDQHAEVMTAVNGILRGRR